MAAVNAVVSSTGVAGPSGVGMPFPNPNALILLEGIESELLSMGIVATKERWAPNGSRPGVTRVADKRSRAASPVVSPGVVAKQDAAGLPAVARCRCLAAKERKCRFGDGYGHPNIPPHGDHALQPHVGQSDWGGEAASQRLSPARGRSNG